MRCGRRPHPMPYSPSRRRPCATHRAQQVVLAELRRSDRAQVLPNKGRRNHSSSQMKRATRLRAVAFCLIWEEAPNITPECWARSYKTSKVAMLPIYLLFVRRADRDDPRQRPAAPAAFILAFADHRQRPAALHAPAAFILRVDYHTWAALTPRRGRASSRRLRTRRARYRGFLHVCEPLAPSTRGMPLTHRGARCSAPSQPCVWQQR
jgi:hypothetical protein